MPGRRSKIVAIVLTLWTVASLLSVATGVSAPALFNRVREIEYGCSEPTIVDSIWIRPCMNSAEHGFTIPLLYSSRSTGSPFSIGVSVLDYSDNNVDCLYLVVDHLVVTIDGKSNQILNDGETISAEFETYYSGTTSTKADAYIDLGDVIRTDNESPISVDATLQIHTSDGIIDQSVSGEFQRGGWRGTWFILEALFPHA